MPRIPPNNLDGIPSIIVIFNIFSNIFVPSKSILNITNKTEKTNKNAIISYSSIFNTVTFLNIPSKLKKGKFLYKNILTGFLNINESIKTTKRPKKLTSSLVKPLAKPRINPNAKIINNTISIIFITSPL